MSNEQQNGAQQHKGFELFLRLMLAGMQSVIPVTSTLVVRGVTMTQAQLVAALEAAIAYFTAVRDAKASLVAALQAKKAQLAAAHLLYGRLKTALESQFGKENPELVKFGLKPRTPAKPLTSAKRVLRAAKAKVTRALRHTMGPRERLAVVASDPTVTLDRSGVQVTPAPADAKPESSVTGTGATPAGSAGDGTPGGTPTTKK